MKNVLKTVLVLFLFFVLFSSAVNAQVIGKIFTKGEVQTLFGKADKSVTFSKSNLQILLKHVEDNVMFMLKNDQLIIRTGEKVIYPAGYKVEPTDVFHVYSKDIVHALLNYMLGSEKLAADKADEVTFEMAGDVMVIGYGAYALEFAIVCPPICP